MTRLKTTALIALSLLAASPTFANPNKNKHADRIVAHNPGHIPAGCHLPPGIEKQMREGKRSTLPPGLDQKCYGKQTAHHRYGRGDRLPDGYRVIRDYDRYGLPDPKGDRYVVSGDTVYKIARDAAIVISAMGIYNNIVGN
jgi:Predicted integral membrane protein